MEHGKTPKIRFAGFNDNWEVRKLGEVMNVTSVKRIHQSDWTNSGIRFLRARDIVAAAKGEEPSDYLYISKNKYDECTALSGKVSVNDILVTGVGTIGVPYLIINSEPLYFKDGNVIWFQNNEKINGKFFYFSFTGSYIQSFIQDSAGIGTVGTYTIETGKITPIQLPTHAEQQRIGEYFSRLDDLIGLYKRKLEKSLNLKKAMLEKMFPQNGKPTPQIRFAGFNDNWEVRKLGEVADFNPKSELPKEFEYVDLESVVGTEMISHRTETKTTAPSRAQRLAKTGDIFFQMVRPYQKNNYLFLKPDNNYVFSTGYAQIRPHIETKFVMSFLQTENFVKMVLDSCTGTSYPAINSNDLANLDISFSPTHAEQQRIGEYFSRLDDLIGLYKRKLEKSLNLKKAMLEKMFP